MKKIKIFLLALAVAGISKGAQLPAPQSKDIVDEVSNALMQAGKRRMVYDVFNYRNLAGAHPTDLLDVSKLRLQSVALGVKLKEDPAPFYFNYSGGHSLNFCLQSIHNQDSCLVHVSGVEAGMRNGALTGSYMGYIGVSGDTTYNHSLYTTTVNKCILLTESNKGTVSKTEKLTTTRSLTSAGKKCVALGVAAVAVVGLGMKYKDKIAAVFKGLKKVTVL